MSSREAMWRRLGNESANSGGNAISSELGLGLDMGIGPNLETNPVVVYNDEGRAIPVPTKDGTYRPAHFEVVQSFRRDPDVYPDAFSFRLNLSKPLRNVFCIEVMELNLPNADSTAPAHREFLILNGTMVSEGGGYKFRPQPLSRDLSFHTATTYTPNSDKARSADSLAASNIPALDDYALGRYKYDSTANLQHWNRSGWKRTTWFPTPVAALDYIELSVVDPLGVPYDFAADEEWSCTLQILSQM